MAEIKPFFTVQHCKSIKAVNRKSVGAVDCHETDWRVWKLVLETFSKSSAEQVPTAERVQALPINLRYIYKRVFH